MFPYYSPAQQNYVSPYCGNAVVGRSFKIMNIQTKFSLNDFVYVITQGGYDAFIPCETCFGAGKVELVNSGKKINCPDCYGRKGSRKWVQTKWICETSGTIGKVEVQYYAAEYKRENEIRYMIDSTGVGSGHCWKEQNLFLSLEDAKKECERLNSVHLEIEAVS